MAILRRIGLAFLCTLLVSGAAHAACGDGVVDPAEHCDHGAANGADGCCTAGCLLVDEDFDALCDASDGCDNFALTARIKEPVLEIRGLATPPGDDVLRFRGRITLPVVPAIDPAMQGMRITLSDSPDQGFEEGTLVSDVLLAPGDRWSRRGDQWTYRDCTGSAGGITRVGVKLRPPIVPSTHWVDVVFVVEGRASAYPVTPEMVTTIFDPATGMFVGHALIAQVAFVAPTAPANAHCGSAYVTSELPTRCTFAAGGAVRCEGPRIGGPCRIGDPDDLIVCDLLNTVRAQERWFARRGGYFTGVCATMPGVVASPGVVCSTAGSATSFTVFTAHPSATRACDWTSLPGVGQNLTCS